MQWVFLALVLATIVASSVAEPPDARDKKLRDAMEELEDASILSFLPSMDAEEDFMLKNKNKNKNKNNKNPGKNQAAAATTQSPPAIVTTPPTGSGNDGCEHAEFCIIINVNLCMLHIG